MKVFVVKIVDTNGVVTIDKVFQDRNEAEAYVYEQEKKSRGWELQIFQYPIEAAEKFSSISITIV